RWSTALNALATGSACAGSLTAIAAIAPGLFASLSLNPSGAAIAQLAVGAVAVAGGLFAAYTLRQPMSLEPSD
ncbi:MAG: hypothetical protein ACR2I8_02880, partial [Steroidobacteraceae bacterium]